MQVRSLWSLSLFGCLSLSEHLCVWCLLGGGGGAACVYKLLLSPCLGSRFCLRPGAGVCTPAVQTSATDTSALGAARAVVGSRGLLGFYRGMAAPLATVAAYNAIVFGTWGAVERVLSPSGGSAAVRNARAGVRIHAAVDTPPRLEPSALIPAGHLDSA